MDIDVQINKFAGFLRFRVIKVFIYIKLKVLILLINCMENDRKVRSAKSLLCFFCIHRHKFNNDENTLLMELKHHKKACRAVQFSTDGTCKFVVYYFKR